MIRIESETELSTIRVLLSSESPLVWESLEAILQREEDIEVVGKLSDPVDLLVAVAETRADVVIHSWPDSGQVPAICTHLLREYPHVLVIGIPATEDRICVCRLVILTTSLLSGGLEDLLSQIRSRRPEAHGELISAATT